MEKQRTDYINVEEYSRNEERELLGFSISDIESYESWKSIYQSLLDRGLKGVKLIISNAHKGEAKAIKECFTELHGNDAKYTLCETLFIDCLKRIQKLFDCNSSYYSNCKYRTCSLNEKGSC